MVWTDTQGQNMRPNRLSHNKVQYESCAIYKCNYWFL